MHQKYRCLDIRKAHNSKRSTGGYDDNGPKRSTLIDRFKRHFYLILVVTIVVVITMVFVMAIMMGW
jgi:hypothetical protein